VPIDDVNPRPRAHTETTYRYDPVVKLIVGGIQQESDGNTYAYGFRPNGPGKGQWSRQRIPGGGAGTQFHHAVYIPELRAHAFLTTVDKRTDLLLWRPDPAAWSTTAGDATPRASITVAGRTVASLQEACDIGGDVRIGAGTLRSQGAKITRPVRIRGAGRTATIIDGDGVAVEGKGVFDCWADASFADLAIVNAAGAAGNIAAIRHEAGSLALSGVMLRHCQNGILGGKPGGATLDMDDCDVLDCGIDESGATHGVYVSAIARASVRRCRFGNMHVGHYFKSRACENLLVDNVLGSDFGDTKSYNIDLCYGGRAMIIGNTLRQGKNCGNTCMISYGAEARFIGSESLAQRIANAGYVVEVRDNRFASTAGGIAFRNALPATITEVRIDIRDNTLAGLSAIAEGRYVTTGTNAVGPAPV
jgi:hypothetical protein